MFSQVFVCARGGEVGFPAYITDHMTRVVCIQGVCLQDGGGAASRGGGVHQGIGQVPHVCLQGGG